MHVGKQQLDGIQWVRALTAAFLFVFGICLRGDGDGEAA
jgi:hypothetical protein